MMAATAWGLEYNGSGCCGVHVEEGGGAGEGGGRWASGGWGRRRWEAVGVGRAAEVTRFGRRADGGSGSWRGAGAGAGDREGGKAARHAGARKDTAQEKRVGSQLRMEREPETRVAHLPLLSC
ncbi:hypothetical protein ABZP36_016664 [Zizania latifolia]